MKASFFAFLAKWIILHFSTIYLLSIIKNKKAPICKLLTKEWFWKLNLKRVLISSERYYLIKLCYIFSLLLDALILFHYYLLLRSRRGRDRMEVVITTTCAISDYHHKCCEFESHSWQGVLKTTLCDKDCQRLEAVLSLLWVLQFPPPIKLTAMI